MGADHPTGGRVRRVRRRQRPPAQVAPVAGGFSLFEGDFLNRALARLGAGSDRPYATARRIALLVGLTWVVLALLSWSQGHLLADRPREAFLKDLAAYAQFLGFIPLSLIAEIYIGVRMALACRHLKQVCDADALSGAMSRAERLAKHKRADGVCLFLGYVFTMLWACDEVSNGLSSWHTAVMPAGTVATGPGPVCVALVCAALGKSVGNGEVFTLAGAYAAFFCLPLFTYLWLRWVWKVVVWTLFLIRLSRLRLSLIATHLDATGGLGSLSDVQTSFGLILFGTGVLFSTAIWYKVAMEHTPVSAFTVWVPIIGYILLAPSVFVGPLFVFSRTLYRVKTEAQLPYGALALKIAQNYEKRWLDISADRADALLSDPQTSTLADFKNNYHSVQAMRVVPFDWRSLKELFLSAAGPFIPAVLDFLELPQGVKAFLELWVGHR